MKPRTEIYRQLVEVVDDLDDGELLAVIRGLSDLYKARVKDAAVEAARHLRSGDLVANLRGRRRLPEGVRGRVCQVKRGGRVLVHFDEHGDWLVDAALLAKVSEDPNAGVGT